MKVEKEALGGQRVEPTEEELALVNRQSRKELTAAEVYLFAVRLCDNEVDRDQERFPEKMRLWMATGVAAQAVFGLFSGMFIGCLALAIAEMLDSIPIFARRISFRHGLGWAILGMAAGKLCGSLLYFATEFYRTVQ